MVGNVVRHVIAWSAISAGMGVLIVPSAGAQSMAVGVAPEASVARTVTLDVKNAPLADVLRNIAKQAGLNPIFGATVATSPRRVTLRITHVAVGDAFEQALRGTGFTTVFAAGGVSIVRAIDASSAQSGTIEGVVVDQRTKQPLRGVTVLVSGLANTVTTDANGRFRVANAAPGTYTVSARLLGYVKATRTVTVVEGQAQSLEFALEPSINALDQIVVTGTIVATAQREVPNAMTIITAADLEARGITQISQLFRGDVPGLFVANTGSSNPLDQATSMYSRGATALNDNSVGTYNNTNPVKTYVDGVELVDPSYLNQVDPTSIERIEILTGPQASTIYGSNALNGVIQIFTKRGVKSQRPRLTASLQSGWIENNFRPTRTPQHNDQLDVQGMEGHWAYNAGGSWNYQGPWTPAKRTTRLSGFGGVRVQHGGVAVDGSLRLANTRNEQRGSVDQQASSYREDGWWTPLSTTGGAAPQTSTSQGQTLGLTLSYSPFAWWSHSLVLGHDESTMEQRTLAVRWSLPSDTMLSLLHTNTAQRSWRYSTTAQGNLATFAKVVITIGGDGSNVLNTQLTVEPTTLTGTLNAAPIVMRFPGHNAGGFLQGQLGLAEQLFLTYGLRAEWNPGFGAEASPNIAPRYGMSFTRDVATPWGVITAKMRASYGRSTRPPRASYKREVRYLQSGFYSLYGPYYGNAIYYAENPDLGPEFQQGGEGGLELYFGTRVSLVMTRYNQTVDGLIANPVVDSARSLVTGLPGGFLTTYYTSLDAEGYGYRSIYQYLNIGSIRNQGWELQGSTNIGPFTTRGTYSWTKSRVIGITPKYRGVLAGSVYQPGASFAWFPEHTWALGLTYAHARTSVGVNVSGIGQLKSGFNRVYSERVISSIRLTSDRYRMLTTGWNQMNQGYVMADLNMTQRFTSAFEGLLQIQNLADYYRNDANSTNAAIGRQTKLGVRLRY